LDTRLLFVTQVDLDQPSGNARHVLGLARREQRQLHAGVDQRPGRPTVAGTRRIRPPAGLRAGTRMELAHAALATGTTLAHRPELAYIRISASTSAVPAALSALRVPIVLELNGPVLSQLELRGRTPLQVAAARASLRGAVRLSRALVAASPALADHAQHELGARRIEIVGNGVELEVAVPGDRGAARRALGLPEELRLVTLVGTLTPELRLDLLAEAHRKLPGVGLLIVGDGAGSDFVKAMSVASRPSTPVLHLGAQPHPVAIQAIQAADVCVNVHDTDLALKGLEYAAVGRRQVCFRVAGAERLEQLYPGLEAVRLVDERSPAALAEALLSALRAERTQGPLPDAAVTLARRELGWERKAERLLEVLDRAR
jgi:glycosyltransferase involved in cell wall biosynthesis